MSLQKLAEILLQNINCLQRDLKSNIVLNENNHLLNLSHTKKYNLSSKNMFDHEKHIFLLSQARMIRGEVFLTILGYSFMAILTSTPWGIHDSKSVVLKFFTFILTLHDAIFEYVKH